MEDLTDGLEVSQVIRIVNGIEHIPVSMENAVVRGTISQQLASRVRELTHNGEDIVSFLLDVLNDSVKVAGKPVKVKIADRLGAADRLLERGFGKAVQAVEVSGAEGGPIESQHLAVIAGMTTEQLIQLAGDRLTSLPAEGEATPDPDGAKN